MVKRMFRLFQVTIERAGRPAVHHLGHGGDVVVVGRQYLAVAPGDWQVRILRLGPLCQLKDGVPVLIELLADLAKQLREQGRGLSELVSIPRLQTVGQPARGALDGFDARLENSRQAQLVFTGQPTNKLEHQGVYLERRSTGHGLQEITGHHLAQQGFAVFPALLGGIARNDCNHLILVKGRELATQEDKVLDHVPVLVQGVSQASWVRHGRCRVLALKKTKVQA